MYYIVYIYNYIIYIFSYCSNVYPLIIDVCNIIHVSFYVEIMHALLRHCLANCPIGIDCAFLLCTL